MKTIKRILILGIPFIFIMACLFHYLYVATGKSLISAVIFPTNESIFEHLKLVLYPTILYFMIFYIIGSKNYNIDFYKWLIGGVVSILINILFILSFYYISKGALNYSSPLIDISSILIGTAIGQLISLHIYINIRLTKLKFFVSILLLLFIIVLFTNLTFNPPHLPLFIDSTTGLYGIQ
jgi:hypothetical protein